MKKRFVISEQEKKDIKKLHRLTETESKLTKILQLFAPDEVEDENDEDTDDNINNKDDISIKYGDIGDFGKITKIVIDKFEGGYWNPFCPHPKENMGVSTETMFGLDRYNGNIESSPEGKEFFKIIDEEKYNNGAKSIGSGKNMKWRNMDKFCKKWKWLYRGGDKEEILKDLAVRVMKNYFDDNLSNFVKTPKLKEKIENIPALTLHMSYATWNGPGFFQKFAKSLENGINQGMSDSQLVNKAIDDRRHTQPLLHQEKVISAMKEVMA